MPVSVDFYEAVVKPLDPKKMTKLVVDELLKPNILAGGGCRVMDRVVPDIYVEQLNVLISHANDKEYSSCWWTHEKSTNTFKTLHGPAWP